MRPLGFLGRSIFAVMLVAGIVSLATASPALAVSKYARITIHKAECPANTKGDIFTKCHGNQLPGVDFTVYNPTNHGTTRTTDAEGHASFGPRAGKNTIVESAADFNAYGAAYVFCKDQNTNHVFIDQKITSRGIILNTSPGAVIICDWYDLT
jgi:hypothetical protein